MLPRGQVGRQGYRNRNQGYLCTMKTSLLILVLGSLVPISLHAQYFHVGGMVGIANYQGDLQDKRFTMQQAGFGAQAGLWYELADKWHARLLLSAGSISADDKKIARNRTRNLNFRSVVAEAQLGLEYDLLNPYENRLTPFFFGGVALFRFNPYTYDSLNRKVYLQPLGTEGQGFFDGREKYQLTQLALPFGGGLKFALSENVRIRFEVGLRKLFTDYLDDVSTTYAPGPQLLANNGPLAYSLAFRADELKQGEPYPSSTAVRGNPGSKDWYYFSTIGLTFRLVKRDDRSFLGKTKTGCPTF